MQQKKFLKPGKVVILLSGRYAGRKAVILQNFDQGTDGRHYPHAIVAGVDRYPLKVNKAMGTRKISKRSRVKPFIKAVNYSHIMPTRYSLNVEDLRDALPKETRSHGNFEKGKRFPVRKQVKQLLEERYVV
jgi:large subunit ribosomal protein L27e